MNALIIYDSNYGNTRLVAEAMAESIKGSAISVKDFEMGNLGNLDLLIVGSPINGWRPTPAIKNFLENIPNGKLKGIQAAAFDTRIKSFLSGNAAKRIYQALNTKGAKMIGTPVGFYVKHTEGPLLEKELENARIWALHLFPSN
ncbi:MAG: flavodoxin family protein [Bacteroidetes bacterium]|nr:flavodoxin family protein [Bacteroidota bacterium]